MVPGQSSIISISWAGLLFLVSFSSVEASEPVVVQSRHVDVEYAVNREAEPLLAVTLWYSTDEGTTWVKYGVDPDRRSPAAFEAPGDGAYGLFFVLKNETGPSSQAPLAGKAPHVTLLVDETPPVVQLHAVRESIVFGKTVVQVKWTAIDSLLGPRPIGLEFRAADDATWRSMTTAPLANTGRYDWTPPDALRGSVAVRVSARDRGGFVSTSDPMFVDLSPALPSLSVQRDSRAQLQADYSGVSSRDSGRALTSAPTVSGSPRARERASQWIDEAKARREAGDARAAIARFRNAVKLDPNRTDAFAEMARLFYGLGEWDRALSAYDIVLQHEPSKREALLGAAMAHTKRKDYSSASENLRTILRHDPRDAEVWMNLGDVAIYGGDEVLARDCYMRASQMDSDASAVNEEARKRLRLMDDVARRYEDR